MAFKNYKGEIERNLQEQVRANQSNDIALAKEIQSLKTLVGFGIQVIDRLDTWVPPTGSYAFGDAIAVGPEGGPFDFYIWTRVAANSDDGYWLNYGPISVVGPQGPQGEPGPQGETGKSSRWFVGPNEPTGDVQENDMWLRVNSDGSTSGFVYQYKAGGWALFTTILGPRGLQGPEGKAGKQGPMGPQGPQGPAGNPSPVINIIAELPEGSVISDTYDPDLVASNSGVLMPVSGVNHLFIIINGNWTDSGSWGQGGTRVYVGGEEATEVNLDAYVKKLPTTNKYQLLLQNGDSIVGRNVATNEYSIQSGAVVCYLGTASGVNRPTSGGNQIVCETCVNPYQAANKQYVDSKISQEIAAAHGDVQHADLKWYYLGEELTLTIGVGVYYTSIQAAGDLTAWGGDLIFYGMGGLVNPSGDSYVDNDGLIHRLKVRCDTGEAWLQCLYSTGQTWANATTLATFSVGGAGLNPDSNTIELGLQPVSGMDGGIFPLNSIPG